MQVMTTQEASRSEKESKPVPSRACDSCRQKKIKCDRALPQCDWCRHHNRICTFSRPAQRRGKKNLEHLGLELERRILLIEKALTDKLLADGLQRPETIKPDVHHRDPRLTLKLIGQWVGMVNSYNGFPFFSSEGQKWVQECTGQRIRLPSSSAANSPQTQGTPPGQPLQSPKPDPEISTHLPSKKIVLDHAVLWKTSFLWQIFPFWTDAQMDHAIHIAYNEETVPGSLESLSAQSFLYSFLAFTTIFGIGIGATPLVDGATCAQRARSLIEQLMWMAPTTETLQAILMLAFFDAVQGELQSVDVLMAMGSRILFTLGAHKFPGPDVEDSPSTQNHRNLFWLFYVLDKDMSIRTGHPPCIVDDQCDLTLPKYDDVDGNMNSNKQDQLGTIRARLSLIKSRAFNSLYSVHAQQKSDAELLRAIIELDEELEKWRMSVPASWRPPLAFSQPKPEDPGSGELDAQDVPFILTRLEYFHCAAIIHQASSRCQVWDNTGQPVKGVRSSTDLSVAASRSTLKYLDCLSYRLKGHAFWIVLLYATSAVLTIFCHILSFPLNPSAVNDISILEKAPTIIHHSRSLSKSVLSPNEALRLKVVTDFLEDLAHLAPLAINKAKAEACS